MMLVDEFSGLLKRKMGLDSRSIGAAAVERAVRHRMSATGVDDERDYLMRVQASPAEMQLLIESVVVPETWFFRYPESQQAMAQLACERLFGAGAADERVLRVLSLPCSSGEEPYSIAMALLDAGVPASRFQIDALDISERVVQFARRGLYGRNSFRGDALDYRDRYFTETGDGHQLSAQVMERVRFQSGNLFDAGLLAHAPAYDFVFCRNLLIYFDQATQERAVQVLRRHTREDGVLFVGPAETSLLTARRLPPVAMPHCFAFLARRARCGAGRCLPVQARGLAGAAGIARPRAAPARAAPTHAPSGPPCGAAGRAGRSRRGQIGIRGRNLAAPDRGAGGPGAREGRDRALRRLERYGASADGFYLQGLLQDAAGDARQAQAAYRKVLYLQPNHREALLHLAALVASEGDHERAQAAGARARQEARRD